MPRISRNGCGSMQMDVVTSLAMVWTMPVEWWVPEQIARYKWHGRWENPHPCLQQLSLLYVYGVSIVADGGCLNIYGEICQVCILLSLLLLSSQKRPHHQHFPAFTLLLQSLLSLTPGLHIYLHISVSICHSILVSAAVLCKILSKKIGVNVILAEKDAILSWVSVFGI